MQTAVRIVLFLSAFIEVLSWSEAGSLWGTPQYIYMELMTDKLQNLDVVSDTKTVLASTPQPISITGLINDEFVLSIGSGMQMRLPCSSLTSNFDKSIHSSSLWMFPKLGENITAEGDTFGITFKVSVSSGGAEATQRRTVNSWSKEEQCMSLDITTASKKFGIKGGINSTNQECTVSVEVTDVEVRLTHDNVSRNNQCNDFNSKTSSTPFLVLTYFDPDSEPEVVQQPGRKEDKRSLGTAKNGLCSKVDHWVNLTDIPYFEYPKKLNIGACSGRCPETQGTFRQYLLNALSPVQDNKLTHSTCCTADALSPTVALIKYDNVYLIEYFADAIVRSCKCRDTSTKY